MTEGKGSVYEIAKNKILKGDADFVGGGPIKIENAYYREMMEGQENKMPSKAMIESAKRGPYDELNTPAIAFRYIEPWCINPIWECTPGEGALVEAMAYQFRTVVTANVPKGSQHHDFLEHDPLDRDLYGMICTNPPFSKKAAFLARCEEIGKPWALLLPIATFGNHYCHPYLEDAEIIFMPHRIDFTGKKRPWFSVAWFTKGLGIGKTLTFSGDLR